MELTESFASKKNMEPLYVTTESLDSVTKVSSKVSTSPKSRKRSPKSPKSPRLAKTNGKEGSSKEVSSKSDKNSYNRRYWRPKKGGAGENGTWGDLQDTNTSYATDHNNPNYSSNEDIEFLSPRRTYQALEEYKKKAIIIVEEYFANDDVISTADELRDIGMPNYDYYFVKKLVSMAMDRHDKEKEMVAILLSSLYADIINPAQVYKGFTKIIECVDDLVVDIPNVVDILSIFIARAIVDDILPPIFLKKQLDKLPKDSKGVEVLRRTEKCYLSAPYHCELIENKWGGNKHKTVEDVKVKISNLLREYVTSGDKNEACRCIKELNVPFFHHEIIKRCLIMAMERRKAESEILNLLKMVAEENLINSSQISKGFNRLIDTIDDLSLDIPNARQILQYLIAKCASDGWLSASSLKSFSLEPGKMLVEEDIAKCFKIKIQTILQEYFLSGDTIEVYNYLESEISLSSELNAIFVKRLINLAMDRKNREKEMASVLLSSLCLPSNDVVNGLISLLESSDDTSLDNPTIIEDLAKFISRSIVDEVIAPSHLEDIGAPFMAINSTANKIVQMTSSLLKAPLFGERILRCWGGEGSRGSGWAVEDVKDKIEKLLEEYECGGDAREACRCIKELSMPFFHHEVVKKALVIVMEKRNERLWQLLEECYKSGLITMNQMTKGFERAQESLEDLALDVPNVKQQFLECVARANSLGWLDSSSFPFISLNVVENYHVSDNQPSMQQFSK